MGIEFGRGYIPDTDTWKDLEGNKHVRSEELSIKHLLGARISVPVEASLEEFVSLAPIVNQTITGSCVGQAFARAIHVRCAKMGVPIPYPSPTNIYTVGRSYERGSTKTPLLDNGCQPRLAIMGMDEWGVASNDVWPFDPGTINDEPTFDELEAASLFELHGYYRIESEGADRLADIQQAIAAGFPVALGVQIDRAFNDYAGGWVDKTKAKPKVVVESNPLQILGGHMTCLVGYKKFGLQTYYRGVNSWGDDWGDGGMYWADPTWITQSQASDFYAISVSPTALGAHRRVA